MSRSPVVDPNIPFQAVPPAASAYAEQVDLLYFALLGLSAVLVLVLLTMVVGFSIRYRKNAPKARYNPRPSGRGPRLEIGFAVFLFLIFCGFFVWASQLYLQLYGDNRDMLEISVVGKQWMWKVQHGNGAREINSLHVPAGQPVRLQITSQDVIHSFYIPALRLKRDAVPGMYNQVSFTATRTGEYRLFCAEFCGLDHSRMRGRVVVMSEPDYHQWLRDNAQGPAPEAVGKALFQAHQCDACHQNDSGSSAVAPDLRGLFGREVNLQNGQPVRADRDYLRRAIMRPNAQVVAGYDAAMPSYTGQLSEEELLQLIAYIRSLPAQSEKNDGDPKNDGGATSDEAVEEQSDD